MLKIYISCISFIFLSLGSFQLSFAESNPKLLEEIKNLITKNDFENAITAIQDGLEHTNKDNYYLHYQLYLQKSLVYKSIFNYPLALDNLNYAEEVGIRDETHRKEVSARVKIEKLFIYFDYQQQEEFRILYQQIKAEDLNLVPAQTRAFFISIQGILAMRENQLEEAVKRYDEAIELLKKEDPKHLPIVYKAKIILYGQMNKPIKAIESFELGLKYAEQYQVQLYKIIMYESLTKYYVSKEDYKNALTSQHKVSELRTAYNANNISGKLNILESQINKERKQIELAYERKKNQYIIGIVGILLILIFILIRLVLVNKQKAKLVERENIAIRRMIQHLPTKEYEKPTIISLNEYNLSARHLEIILLVKKGKTNKEIGEELFISENTVKYHLKSIYDILGIGNRIELRAKVPGEALKEEESILG
ncbi:response regulator transcription factor [Sphingobacterium sp. HJSM2_6]|uniref:response regulator transcription factor n=1 Tax=Sphingobacterium sp. HJSM2_6 TaxID=3366264 RepID=UPI003BC71425